MSKFWVIYWTVVLPVAVLIVLTVAPPGTVEAFGKLLGGIAPLVTVCLAIFGVFVWRLQLVAKRRFELAEEALVATFAVVYALEAIRSPFAWGGEGSTRKQGENETAEQKEKLDQAFVPFERMAAHADAFSALAKSALLMEAHFDKPVADSMRLLLGARGQIASSANMMRRLSGLGPLAEGSQKTYDRCHAVLYASGSRDSENPAYDDVLSEEIENARKAILAELKSYLAEPTLKSVMRVRSEKVAS
jgi:hypothetical protein